jgi:methyltransferase (TIGR00027 family)
MNETPISDVTDTAAWVASYRARETLRSDALFQDPLAKVLAGSWGENIATQNKTFGAEWYIIIRTLIIDTLILNAVKSGVDTIVNLGAGLDTRPYRLDLPKELLWIEVDYPRIIEMKEKKLKGETANCRLERVALDLSLLDQRAQLLDSINSRAQQILILTEGVLPYLTEQQVSSLAQDLSRQSHVHYWIVDYFAPGMIRTLGKRSNRKQMQNAPFLFNPSHWNEFFEESGWNMKEMKYVLSEGRRLGRNPPLPAIGRLGFHILPHFLQQKIERLSGFALLESKPKS